MICCFGEGRDDAGEKVIAGGERVISAILDSIIATSRLICAIRESTIREPSPSLTSNPSLFEVAVDRRLDMLESDPPTLTQSERAVDLRSFGRTTPLTVAAVMTADEPAG